MVYDIMPLVTVKLIKYVAIFWPILDTPFDVSNINERDFRAKLVLEIKKFSQNKLKTWNYSSRKSENVTWHFGCPLVWQLLVLSLALRVSHYIRMASLYIAPWYIKTWHGEGGTYLCDLTYELIINIGIKFGTWMRHPCLLNRSTVHSWSWEEPQAFSRQSQLIRKSKIFKNIFQFLWTKYNWKE